MNVILILLGAVSAVSLVGTACWRLHRLQAAIRTERAAVRLTQATHHRDMDAFRNRVKELVAEHRAVEARDLVLAEAEQIITAEYARTTRTNPQEGESP